MKENPINVSLLVIVHRPWCLKNVVKNFHVLLMNQVFSYEIVVCTHIDRNLFPKNPFKIKFISKKFSDPIGKSRNRLLDASSGSYKFFMDDDDIQFKCRIPESLAFMVKNNLTGTCLNQVMIFEKNTKLIYKSKPGFVGECSLVLRNDFPLRFKETNIREGDHFQKADSFKFFTDDVKLILLIHHNQNTISRNAPKDAFVDLKVADFVERFLNS